MPVYLVVFEDNVPDNRYVVEAEYAIGAAHAIWLRVRGCVDPDCEVTITHLTSNSLLREGEAED